MCVKFLLQKAVHAPCSLCWLHKWGGLQAQLLHIAPGNARGSDVALIKVSRSEMSCKRGQSSLLGLPSAADIMKRATCFMRGNAPCGVKGVMGYALSARGIFAQAQKCRMYQSRSTFPQGAALGYGQHLGFQPATNNINLPIPSSSVPPARALSRDG